MNINQPWRTALTGSLLLHVGLFLLVGAFWSWETIHSRTPVYVEVTMAELFSPVEESGGNGSAAMPPSPAESQAAPRPAIDAVRPADVHQPSAAQDSVPFSAAVGTAGGTGSSSSGGAAGSGTGSGIGTGAGSGTGTGAGPTRGPRVVEGGRPEYPEVARSNGWEGIVRLQILVNTEGLVDEVRVVGSSGHPELDRAAQQTIRAWRFSPALKKGAPVPAWATVPIVFDLR